ncbi:MAG: hypothetical protein DRN47_06030 [Candidatus Wolframiiraptor sp.]|nr:MAG: hypothetical protein DRN47_06030 [Candidatus Wolframiiraptor sp.]
MWDTCKRGKLFFPEVYDFLLVKKWTEEFLVNVVSPVKFPNRFNKQRIVRLFIQRAIDSIEKSEFKKIYDSIDSTDRDSIKDLIRKSREKAKAGFERMINFLRRNEEFPPILWMEFKRFNQVYIDTMQIMISCIDKWYKLFPKTKSEIPRKSRIVKILAEPYDELATDFMNVFINFFKVLLFLEVWSCETEDELFTDKPWSFKNVDFEAFEAVFFNFHDSINDLSRSLLRFKRKEVLSNFSDPVGWAFKRLMLISGV